jgi:hypothetical protein
LLEKEIHTKKKMQENPKEKCQRKNQKNLKVTRADRAQPEAENQKT